MQQAKRASAHFDVWIANLLARLVSMVEGTSMAANPRMAAWLDALRSPAGHADSTAGIVTHADQAPNSTSASTVSPRAVRLLSMGARTGLVIFIALVLAWVWPRGDGGATSRAAARNTPPPTATSSLAIINPANMGGSEAPLKQPAVVSALENAAEEAPMVVVHALPGSQLFDAGQTNDGESPDELEIDAIAMAAGPPLVADMESETVPASAEQADEVVLIDADMAGAERKRGVEPTPIAPFIKIVSTISFDFTPTPVPQPTSDAPPTPTPAPIRLEPGRLWSNFAPSTDGDHFWVERPLPPFVRGQLASPNYQFGSTAGGRYRIHHGMDISDPMGTPIRAAVTGEVVHAGWDDPELLGPYNGFYGNAVVIRLDQRLPVAGGEMDVYVLYGHLSETLVEKGQRVQPDDIVGRVGMSGIAIGPHLHVEMRLGANTYEHSVNPYLWVQPKDKSGAVAVRLLTADGRTWPRARLSLARFEGGKAVWARVIETYSDNENITPDPMWGENGAMGSVPPGYYVLVGNVNGERVRAELTVESGKTTFVELRTQQ
jgi:murein DD-endopeptidase MepM/ murein hydrolase activator NlpD